MRVGFLYIIGGVLSQIIMLIFWYFLPRTLDNSDVSAYINLLFYTDLFSVLVCFGGDSMLIRFLNERHRKQRDIFFQIFLTSSVILTIVGIVLRMISFKDVEISILLVLSNVIFIIVNSYFIAHRKVAISITLNVVRGVSMIIIFRVLCEIERNYVSVVFAGIFSNLLIFTYFILKLKIFNKIKGFSYYFDNSLFLFSRGTLWTSIIGVISAYISRKVLISYSSIESSSIYVVFYVLYSQCLGIFSSFNKGYTPLVFDNLKKGVKNIPIKYLFYFSIFLFIFLIFLITFGRHLIFSNYLKPDAFNKINILFVLFLGFFSQLVYVFLYPYIYFDVENVNKVSIISSLFLLVEFVLNYYLIIHYDIWGAAFASVLSLFFFVFWLIIQFQSHLLINTNFLVWFVFSNFVFVLVSMSISSSNFEFIYIMSLFVLVIFTLIVLIKNNVKFKTMYFDIFNLIRKFTYVK